MELKIYPEMSDLERLQMLKANSLEERKQMVTRDMTPEERDQCFELVGKKAETIELLEEEAKEIATAKKAATKILKTATKQMSKPVIDEEKTVFDMPDFEKQQVTTYDADGNFIGVRRMNPKERQLRIGDEVPERKLKTGTNN